MRSPCLTTCCLHWSISSNFQWNEIYFLSTAILSQWSPIKYCSLLSPNPSHNLNVIWVSVPCGNYHRNNWIMALSAAVLISHRRFVCSRILNSTHDVFKSIKLNTSYEYQNAWLMCLFQRSLLQRQEMFGIKSACRKSDRHAADWLIGVRTARSKTKFRNSTVRHFSPSLPRDILSVGEFEAHW